MNFRHNRDQLDLRDGCREFLRAQYKANTLRDLAENSNLQNQVASDNWQQLIAMGLVTAMLPEQYAGLELDVSSYLLLAEEMGYVALPEPVIEVATIVLPLLASIDNQVPRIEAIGAGQLRVLPNHSLNPYINRFQFAHELLVIEPEQSFIVEASKVSCDTQQSIDPLRQLSKVSVQASPATTIFNQPNWYHQASQLGALMNAAQLVGLSAAMIDMATEYVKQRQQFGRAIGSFQAVKHHLSSAFVQLEFARPVLYRAAVAYDQQSSIAEYCIAHAKLAAIDCALNAAECAIQCHGAMGYTYEVPLHLWMKRVWALVGHWGDRSHHFNKLELSLNSEGCDLLSFT